MDSYNLNPEFIPKGDQSKAIDQLCNNLSNGKKGKLFWVLLEAVKLIPWQVQFQE